VNSRLRATLAALPLLAGCATGGGAHAGPGQKLDPWENWNRKVFAFNEGLDEKFLRPVATTYADIVPQPVRLGINNFFNNAADAWSAVNNLLQGKFAAGMQDVIRFGTNTVFGVFGVFDVAVEMGIDHQYEDFGQTLGHWGFGAGAYIVWPLFGPSSVRDSFALPLDRTASPALLFGDKNSRYTIYGLSLINTRANLLGASRVVDDIALDKYTFIRDAYLQRRRSLVLEREDEPEPEPPEPPAPGASGAQP
jgi:phospholipid-binding lipoprotein MlaA